MKIITARRISQAFFLALFLWFCWVSTFGTRWWELRGWPVNLFLELDPLVAIGTVLTTHTLYKGLLWALLTVAVTILLGRVFCGWVCPFGTMHHFLGHLGTRAGGVRKQMEANRYRKAQSAKYFILLAFLALAAVPATRHATLQSGLLDPIPFVYRSINLGLIPLLSGAERLYAGINLIVLLFIAALLLNFLIPRFYCRFLCPLGALLGILGRWPLFRVFKAQGKCTHCDICEKACEGACEPGEKLRVSECLVCMNCTDGSCKSHLLQYGAGEPVEPQLNAPDVGRRGVLIALASGALALPMVRLAGNLGPNHHPGLVRPPGSLSEGDFLERCIKCGQCMRVCPTNTIVPAGLNTGLETLFTPVLSFRNGTSGCQLNCVACGNICPTAAIRPITLNEKLGAGKFEENGPIRIGTAFVDRGRCLPWAMDTPCIVCQENCPVTPKAIFTKEIFEPVRGGLHTVEQVEGNTLIVSGEDSFNPAQLAGGDYFAAPVSSPSRRSRIVSAAQNSLALAEPVAEAAGDRIQVFVRLQAPCVDIARCIGCGICEHECPVRGLRAIRVSAENETRDARNSLTLERKSIS